jgi:hypothetical protein
MLSAGLITAAVMLAAGLFVAIVARPQLGAYAFLLLNPLIVGIARGDLLPVMRPNELLLIVILLALLVRTVLAMLAGREQRLEVDRIDLALVLMAVTSSILPLLLRYGRGLPVSSDDLLYSIVLWKYLLLYRIFRGAVVTPEQAATCLWLSMASAAVVAVIAILQVNDWLGVPAFLVTYYDQPFEGHIGYMTERATSTIASSFGLADVMVMNLVVAIALLRVIPERRWLLVMAALLFLSGCVAAGAFSGFIGLAVSVLATGIITGHFMRVLGAGIPAGALASVAFWPVIVARLSGFQGSTGVPQSWTGRWENLQQFFLPELFSGLNWLLGVRPAPRLPASESWRDYIYIESGYVWLLWIGGIPLLLAFAFFVWVSGRQLWRVAGQRTDAVGSAAIASLAYLVVIATLMLLDPHLTVRGSADLFFPLLGLSLVRAQQAPVTWQPETAPDFHRRQWRSSRTLR